MSTAIEPAEEQETIALATCDGTAAAVPAIQPEPARLFYGWVMLPLATILLVATSPGQTFGVAFFNTHFLAEFGLSKTGLSTIYLAATLLASFCIPMIGHLVDKFGLRRAVLCALTAMALACVGSSQIAGSFTMFLAFLALRVTGPGTLTLLSTNTLAAWFDRRLGKVSSFTQIAMASSWAIVPVVFVTLIEKFGWRGAYLAIAAIFACGLVPLMAVFYRQSPSDLGQRPDGLRPDPENVDDPPSTKYEFSVGEAARHRGYWILVASTALWALIGTGLIFHLAAMFESIGLSAKDSTRSLTSLALVMATMQLVGGILADRIAMRWLLLAAMSLLTTACVLFANVEAYALLAFGFVVFGASQGLMTIIANTAWARFYGRKHLGKIRGTSLTAAVAGSAIGPVVMGVSADYLGGFAPSFWLFAIVAGAVSLAAFWATPPEAPTRQVAV